MGNSVSMTSSLGQYMLRHPTPLRTSKSLFLPTSDCNFPEMLGNMSDLELDVEKDCCPPTYQSQRNAYTDITKEK
jgi:hypothetical protein